MPPRCGACTAPEGPKGQAAKEMTRAVSPRRPRWRGKARHHEGGGGAWAGLRSRWSEACRYGGGRGKAGRPASRVEGGPARSRLMRMLDPDHSRCRSDGTARLRISFINRVQEDARWLPPLPLKFVLDGLRATKRYSHAPDGWKQDYSIHSSPRRNEVTPSDQGCQ